MSLAQQFIDQLREGNTTEAINTLKESIHEKSMKKIEESRQEVLESLGFKQVEEKKKDEMDEEESDDNEDEDDEEEDEEDLNEASKNAPKAVIDAGLRSEYGKVVMGMLAKNQKAKIAANKAFMDIASGTSPEEAIKKINNQDAKNAMREVVLKKGKYEA